MAKDTTQLVLDECRTGYYLRWVDDDGEGAWVGQDHATSILVLRTKLDSARAEQRQEDYEYLCVELAAQRWAQGYAAGIVAGEQGYIIASKARALQFRNQMRATRKSAQAEFAAGTPWPDWARSAAANGWVPPKGWKP